MLFFGEKGKKGKEKNNTQRPLMLRGYAHAIITTPNLYDPLVQLQTKIVAFFIRCDLPALSPRS
jgi:hypothetical protein